MNSCIRHKTIFFQMKVFLNLSFMSRNFWSNASSCFRATNGCSARILGIFPLPRKSHFILASNLMKGLAKRGHEIVMITPFPNDDIPKNVNFKEILIPELINNDKMKSPFSRKGRLPIHETIYIVKAFGEWISTQALEHPKVKSLLSSDEKFDAVVLEQFHLEALKVFAWHYKAPLIIFSSIGPNSWLNYYVGIPAPLSYIPEIHMLVSSNMKFFQRLENVYIRVWWNFYKHFLSLPAHNKILHRFFLTAPHLESIIYNTSLVLLSCNIPSYPATPRVPNMIDIGGFHVKRPKKLPSDLQKILDNAKHGAIYCSFGSTLRSADLPPHIRDIFVRVFSKLKQTVLWKYEEPSLPGQTENIVIRNWFPRQDLLCHPNIQLFINHGGLLSKIESIYHGIPVLLLPVFGDQFFNTDASVKGGFALGKAYIDLTENYLEKSIMDMLNDSKYRENAKKVSKIHHDKPSKPLDTAAFWIEYVIRHEGAPHLRVGALSLNWYQYLLLDVVAFSVILILLVISSSIYLLRKIVNMFMKKDKDEPK